MPLSRLRFPLLAFALLMLILASLLGLMRLGWRIPVLLPAWLAWHGPLMLAVFLGTLISIERAVALGQRWMYGGPALTVLGGVLLLSGLPPKVAQVLIILGSLGLVAIFGVIVRRHFALYTVIMAVGSVAWGIGNLVWLVKGRIPMAVPWWIGFLILTIAGERLELGRLANFPRWVLAWFLGTVVVMGVGWVLSVINLDLGVRISGVGIIGVGLWLLRFDVARKTVRRPGLTRFIAVCMLSGYVWLMIGGGLGLAFGGVMGGAQYDAILHTIFLGFAFSMIFGHAPIIFPAILGRMIRFSPRFYVHLGLLHVSLIVRITGDLLDAFLVRRWGGLFNGIALLIFLGNTVWAVWGKENSRAKTPSFAK